MLYPCFSYDKFEAGFPLAEESDECFRAHIGVNELSRPSRRTESAELTYFKKRIKVSESMDYTTISIFSH